MKKITLILLAVLGTFCSATATAQETAGQFKARQIVSMVVSGATMDTATTTAKMTFFAVPRFSEFVSSGESVTIDLADFVGDTLFFICRDPLGKTACFDPLKGGERLVDVIPAQSAGEKTSYMIVQTLSDGNTVVAYGFANTKVDYQNGIQPRLGTSSVFAKPVTVQPCERNPVGTECIQLWVTEPNFLDVIATGSYSADSELYFLASARDGSIGRRPVQAQVESADTVGFRIPLVTKRSSPISITEFDASTKEFRTLIDVIAPLSPAGTQSEVR